MNKFEIKSYRCEWQIVLQTVNQYGSVEQINKIVESFPTYQDAVDSLPKYGKRHEYVKTRWVPHDNKNDYAELSVRYVEVLLNEFLSETC